MSNKFFGAIGISGGSDGYLDDIDGANLSDIDGAILIGNDLRAGFYRMDSDSGLTQSVPTIMQPDANAGTKRWLLGVLIGTGFRVYESGSTDYMSVEMSSADVLFDNIADGGKVVFQGENSGNSTMLSLDPAGAVEAYYGGTKEAETVSGGLKATNGLQIASSTIMTDIKDEDDMVSNSATALVTQQSVKVYSDGVVSTHAALTATHGVSGAIVGTTDSQTLTNKTLTSPVIDTGVSGTAVKDEDNMASNSNTALATQQSIKAYVDTSLSTHAALTATHGVSGAIVGTTDSQTLSSKTLTSPVIDTSVSGTAIKDEDNMASNSNTALCTQQSIKAYVDGAIDTDVATHAALTATHGVSGAIVGTTDSQTLSSKTLTSPVINTSVSGTAIKDEDNMASNSATALATQQSIKAYADGVVATHAALTATHGASGAIVGTTNTQTLTNKTLTTPYIGEIRTTGSEKGILITANGAVTLYHDNSAKLATSSSGVTVTGTLAATTVTGAVYA